MDKDAPVVTWKCERCHAEWDIQLESIGVYSAGSTDYEFACPRADGGILKNSMKIAKYRQHGQVNWIDVT